MSLKIYNSLTKKKEEFTPLEKGKVKMYVCGPTVYDEPHIGHLRSAYVFDMIRRYLEYSKYKVTFVRNVTDVDDKIIEKAKQEGYGDLKEGVRKVSEKYLHMYHQDLETFGIRKPTYEPKATEHIDEMKRMIQKLLDMQKAYLINGEVYFEVNTYGHYGQLSHQNADQMLDHVRIEPNPNKKTPLDFALWKKAKEGEPAWDSPWGKGRPGWHIECSAMSMKYLGSTFDIHGGGRDLIFPHHENEIAQSEVVTGSAFVRYWVHHGLVTVNNQKMSKSLKNYVTLSELSNKHKSSIEELKFLFLGTHYSAPLDYSEDKMAMQRSIRSKFIEFIMKAEGFSEKNIQFKEEWVKASKEEIEKYAILFHDAMTDDFNTSLAVSVMHELVNHVYKRWSDSMSLINESKKMLKKFFELLGLSYEDAYLSEEITKKLNQESKQLNHLLSERKEARDRKDFKKADELRQQIQELYKNYDIEIIDNKDGSTEFRAKLR